MSLHFPAIFKKDTGEIVATGMFSCPEDYVEANFTARLDLYGASEHAVIDADPQADPDIHYVIMLDETYVLTPRPPIPYVIDKTEILADGQDYLTITGLHNPCTIVVDDPDPTVETVVHTVEDGGFEFEADTPGLYIIEISRFPFLPARIEITAT
jgi:hypothetical protein